MKENQNFYVTFNDNYYKHQAYLTAPPVPPPWNNNETNSNKIMEAII